MQNARPLVKFYPVGRNRLGLSVSSASKLPLLPSIKPSNRSRHNLQLSSPQNPNCEPVNHRLIHHLNVGHLHKAISTLDLMAQLHLNSFTPTT